MPIIHSALDIAMQSTTDKENKFYSVEQDVINIAFKEKYFMRSFIGGLQLIEERAEKEF